MSEAWVIIRTEIKRETACYRAVVELGHDAWLPTTPRFGRAHRKLKHRREWWVPTMPTVFFAKVDPLDVFRLEFTPYFRGIVRKWSGAAIVLDETELLNFRRGIEAENAEIVRQGHLVRTDQAPRASKAQRPQTVDRPHRKGPKPPRASARLVEFTERLIKSGALAPCGTHSKLLGSAPDRICPDPQATLSVEPRGPRPEPAIGAD